MSRILRPNEQLSIRWTLFPLLLLLSGLGTVSGARIPIVLSTDVGNEIDDQWAIVYTLLSPEFEVLGLLSAHAPSIAPPAGRTAYYILRDVVENRLGMASHPPILEGASYPLEDKQTPRQAPGVDFLIETSKGFSAGNRLRVLTVGAVTDVASAILLDPTIVDRIEVIDMGFNEWPKGGDGFNILNDVKAAQIIFESDVPVVVGCADVCMKNLALGFDQAKEMVSDRGPIGKWLWDEFQGWYYRFVKPLRQDDFSKPWIIWDNITMAYLLGMTEHETYQRPVLNDDLSFELVATDKTITWITDLDEERMWADFLRKIDLHQQTHALGPYRFRPRLTFLLP
jgi:inosine-uridine nucleoside N-ribohydrolase